MDDRIEQPLTDSALDEAIEAALNVDHSPEFPARLRMRMAQEDVGIRAAAPVLTWRAISAGSAAVATALLVVAIITWRPELDAPAIPAPPAEPIALQQPRIPIEVPVVRLAAIEASRASEPRMPEVIIARDEIEAIATMVRGVQEGRIVVVTADLAAQRDYSTSPEMLMLAPLAIEPLPRLSPLQENRP